MTSPAPCPVCGGALDVPMRVELCGACYQDLRSSGAIKLASTAEFKAVTPEQAEALMQAPGRPRSRTADGVSCTWCGKHRDQVRKILSSGSAHICNECVALCSDVMADELGPDWR